MEFRTLNRSIDEAIADAVTAFGAERESAILDLATDLHRRLGELAGAGEPAKAAARS